MCKKIGPFQTLCLFLAMMGMGIGQIQAQSPWSQLMIVEYVDQSTGSGAGIEIYNPTAFPVDLGLDSISLRFFNYSDTNPSGCAGGNDKLLTGIIPPGGTLIVGNADYCALCPGSCDTVITYIGFNGNDAVLLARLDSAIDMIGIPCFYIGRNGQSYTVGITDSTGVVADALFQHSMERCIWNTTYYSDSNGVYIPGAAHTPWPMDSTTIVIGWKVDTSMCIDSGHSQLCILPSMPFYASVKTKNCISKISWTFEYQQADFFEILRLDGNGGQLTRAGVVNAQPGSRKCDFEIKRSAGDASYYQIYAWANGERIATSDRVDLGFCSGDCDSEFAVLYPLPVEDDLFVKLLEAGPLSCKLYDGEGQVEFTYTEKRDFLVHTLRLRELPAGLHYYELHGEKGLYQQGKLVIRGK